VKLKYTPRAASDLEAIADYLNLHSPRGAASVRRALEISIVNISAFPSLGRSQSAEGVRKVATRRYPYLIYYSLDLVADEIIILTIQHAARDREFIES
jgi:toxin ParE1/3/4